MVVLRAGLVDGISEQAVVGTVVIIAEREIRLVLGQNGPIEQQLLAPASARRAHDTRMLGARKIFDPISIGAIG
jgi:hypothetical protein